MSPFFIRRPVFSIAVGMAITNWVEFEHDIEVFRFHIALVCLYFTIVLKYDVHLIWEFSGKLWLSWTICVGNRAGSVKQENGKEEKLMINLTNVSNTILELEVGKWYVTVLCFTPVYSL